MRAHVSLALGALLVLSSCMNATISDPPVDEVGGMVAGVTPALPEPVEPVEPSVGGVEPSGGQEVGGSVAPAPQAPQPGVSVECVPSPEQCDGLDNDCDSEVDESLSCPCTETVLREGACYGGPPETRAVGLCQDGVRRCDSSGEVWLECADWTGPSVERCTGEEDEDCDGLVDEADCFDLCSPGAERACYGGPAGTEGVGICINGRQVCQDDENWGPCMGDQQPEEERCFGSIDEDCDGQVDEEGCVDLCSEGAVRGCYTGPSETNGVGICAGGVQSCQADETWGACMGEQLPLSEVCEDGIDNDCDGVIDTDCYDELLEVVDERTVGVDIIARPVDFIMAVDNSGSMSDTVDLVNSNLVELANRLLMSGVNYQLIMVSTRGTGDRQICVPEPLAGPNCGNNTNYTHINESVGSRDAFEKLLECRSGCEGGGYEQHLRPGSLRQVLIVTDDDSRSTWASFRDPFQSTIGEFILHGIIGMVSGGCVARVGEVYKQGIQETLGEELHICDQDWGEVINVLLDATLSRLQTSFNLSQEPALPTLEVFIRDMNIEVPLDPANWNYLPQEQAIELIDIELPEGTVLVIRYRVF